MKKKMLRKLRETCNELIREEETNKIITETIEEVLEETKPKKKTKKGDK
jgi:hypothetical protein|nr:MAG TPA: hypothetical protein [Caudoviricetes sp.]